MLSDADGDDRLAILGQSRQFGDRMLLQNAIEAFVVIERILALPLPGTA